MATGCDWLPTLVSVCDLVVGPRTFDGKDLSRVIASETEPTPHEVFHWQSGKTKLGPQWAVRKGDWKLIANPNDTSAMAEVMDDDSRFLVNLGDSVHELQNLASQHPEIVKELETLHDQWESNVNQ